MIALVCASFGPPESLRLATLPRPQPGPGEVRIRVAAAGVNFPDSLMIEGKYQFHPPLPFAPGGEAAGFVESVGEGVTQFRVGQRVAALTLHGAFAEFVVVRADRTFALPPNVSLVAGAAVLFAYGTSHYALKQRAQLQPGETVLVLGAAGGAGLSAVQLAKAMGARVVAAASTEEKLTLARQFGADETINYRSVVGAGIGGLSAALALAQKGVNVTVVERAPELSEVGAGIQLGPNGFRAAEALGVATALEAACFEPNGLVLRDSATGEELVRQDLGRAFADRFGRPYRLAHRADVQTVLLQAVLRESARITLLLGCELTSLDQAGSNVTARLANGAALTGSAIIGADGLWSSVRRKLLNDGPPRWSGHIAYRALLPLEAVPSELRADNVQVWLGPRHHLVSYKVRGGALLNIVAIFHATREVHGWNERGDMAELKAGFPDVCPALDLVLNQIREPRAWALYDRDPTPGWSKGLYTLLGDAAHPMLPYMAQGACMAMEDAVVLAEEIADQADDIGAALQSYADKRFKRTAAVQLAARQTGAAYHADGAARVERDAMFARVGPRDYEPNAWLFEGEAGPGDRPRAGLIADTGMADQRAP